MNESYHLRVCLGCRVTQRFEGGLRAFVHVKFCSRCNRMADWERVQFQNQPKTGELFGKESTTKSTDSTAKEGN